MVGSDIRVRRSVRSTSCRTRPPAGGANPPSPYDPTDAVYAVARMLCTNGAANGANLQPGFFAYNHSDTYATEVIALANSYGQTQAPSPHSSAPVRARLWTRPVQSVTDV